MPSNELGLDTLNDRRCSCKLSFFHKIIKVFSFSYRQKSLCFCNVQHYQTRSKSTKIIEQISTWTKVFQNPFFPYCIKDWLKLGDETRIIESAKQFKKTIFYFIRSKEKFIYAISDTYSLTGITSSIPLHKT